MRRWLVAASVAAVLSLAACSSSLPAGVDGNLVDDWAAMPAPTTVAPVVGACYANTLRDMIANPPVDCTQSHDIEVSFVGTFTGDAATEVTPPVAASATMSTADAACAAPTTAYLGADWHTGLVELGMTVPDSPEWSAGARWFRCDLRELAAPEGMAIPSATSLRDVLATAGAHTITCVGWTLRKTEVEDIHAVPCARPHDGEYAGYFVVNARPFPTSGDAQQSILDPGCSNVVAKFLGLTPSAYTNQTVGLFYSYLDEDQWNAGDRSVRCYAAAYTKSRKFVGSVKGIGNKPAKG